MKIKNSNLEATPESTENRPPSRVVSFLRAILIGCLLVPINVFWITVVEVRWYTLDGTSLPLFITPVFFLFLIVLGNLGWRKIKGTVNSGLRQEEMLAIYIMLVVSCSFAGHDTLQDFFGCIGHAYWYASPENRWQSLFFRFIPHWLVMTNHAALKGYYEGNVSIYGPDGRHYLMSWIVPLLVWGGFFLTLVGVYLCMTIIVRKGWIENEKLTFPIVQLPLVLTSNDSPMTFFKKPAMWAGFGLAFGVSFMNGLHILWPGIPDLHVKLYSIDQYFTTPPWNAIGSTQSSFYPFAIGLAYFMPLDLSFSCWFFYILARLFRVTGAEFGWNTGSGVGFPYFGEQAAGAWFGIGVMLLYTGRRYWASAVQMALKSTRSSNPAEALQYRWAFTGLIAGVSAMMGFTAIIGMSFWISVGFFAIVLLLGFTITRVRAELGSPHEIVWVNPIQVLVTIFGTQAIGAQDLTLLSTFYWFNRGYRNHPMPNQLEAFKMYDGKPGVKFGSIVWLIVISSLISLVSVDWANLHVTYAAGGGAKAAGFKGFVGGETYDRLTSWLNSPTQPASTGLYYILGGFLLVVLLSVMRTQFVWWPFHPAGYALAISYAMEYFWLPVLIAWASKAFIIRYGGVKAYRAAIPFFLGLILGDYTMGALWALIGPIMGIQTYKIYI